MKMNRCGRNLLVLALLGVVGGWCLASSGSRSTGAANAEPEVPNFPAGYLDQYAFVPVSQFGSTPSDVKEAYTRAKRERSSSAAMALLAGIMEHPKQTALTKALVDGACACRCVEAVQKELARIARGKEADYRDRLRLAYFTFVGRCMDESRQRPAPMSPTALKSLAKEVPTQDVESRAVLLCAAQAGDNVLARELGEKFVRTCDLAEVRLVLVQCYLHGTVPMKQVGKELVPDYSAPSRANPSEAMRHARAALKLQPAHPFACFIVGLYSTGETSQRYLRLFQEHDDGRWPNVTAYAKKLMKERGW